MSWLPVCLRLKFSSPDFQFRPDEPFFM
jgi:hypothetical protein